MADISRDTYDRSKRQSKIVFQEKKPLLNYELNLVQDILNEKSIDISNYGLGDNYVGEGFTVYPSTMNNEIFIKKGIFYHKGYPIELTEDVRINTLSTPPSDRTDLVYAEWYVDEIDGTDDPDIVDSNLGFETTVQERIIIEIKVRENAADSNSSDPDITFDINADPVIETVTYNNANKTISLHPLSGNVFPDWLLQNFPIGVTFTTSDPQNPGPFTINSSSPLLSKKTLVVNEALNDTPPYNTVKKLSFFDSNSSKSWIANRRNFFNIAYLNRIMGNSAVTDAMVLDVRDKMVYNFVVQGCRIEQVDFETVKVNPGRLLVGDVEHFIEDGTEQYKVNVNNHPEVPPTPIPGVPPAYGTLLDNSLNFLFINKAGHLECQQEEPLDYHALLAEVYVIGGSVHSILDRRKFVPFAWKNKYGGGSGEGETGFPTITHQYTSAETLIPAYAAVTILPGSVEHIRLASAVDETPNPTRLPAIGIAGQDMPLGQRDNIITFGEIRNTSWNFTFIGLPVYIDTSLGLITQTPPTLAGTFVQRIGTAISSDLLFVDAGGLFIKNNPPEPFDTNFLVKRPNGLIEEATSLDKMHPDKLSFLASVAQNPNDRSFDIYPGRYFINDTEYYEYSGETINLGSGVYQTSPLTADFFNKAFFTLDETGTVKMYESLESSASAAIDFLDPEIPDNELPLTMVVFQDDGSASAGTIKFISQDHLEDKRNWLSLGSLDNTAFKPVYRNTQNFLIQKGEGWFNNEYIDSTSNLLVTATTASSGSTYYMYMDLFSATGTVSSGSFITMLSTPSQVDRRRYVPLGEYGVDSSSDIIRSSFKAYKSKFWQYRDTPYTHEETFNLSVAGDSAFTLSNFTFLSTDYLDIKINGRQTYENEDYVKVAPNLINFGYTVKKGAKIKVRKV